MGDIELTFDEIFASSRTDSQPEIVTQSVNSTLPISDSISPMYPKVPNTSTTVTPVFTPNTVKPPWNYRSTLEEAFPDADFIYTEYDEEGVSLEDWICLRDFESPSEDYRLAVLIRDRLPWQDEKEDDELYLMSGALPNDGEEEGMPFKAGAEPEVKDENEDEHKIEDKGKNKVEDRINDKGAVKMEREDCEKCKENVHHLSDQDNSSEDSEDNPYESDDFDELPLGTGTGIGWL